MTVAIAAAGTGGHVLPALAVARELVAGGMDPGEVVFLGGDRFEARAVPAAGFPFEPFQMVALRRSLSPRNLGIPLIVRRTARAMAATLRARGTRVVLGMGGYATVPAALAARRLGLPLFVQEQNAIPGLAIRFAARRARAVFVGLPGPAEGLPRAMLTGNPLRAELARFERGDWAAAARGRYGLPEGTLVLGVLGGSLGARVLNQAVPVIVDAWRGGPLAVVHLAGAEASAVAPVAEAASLPWCCLPFEEQMQFFYAAADLVLCRAGAMTISELAATGTPAILVPLERVGQQHNAAALVAAGGARLVPQSEVNRLPAVVANLLGDSAARSEMARSARSAGRPEAAAVIARRLREAVDG
ncbi:MAG TPA: UDP-N-acetylglucosamine--N-acetylmuramyl-(pentapeptide) pyrophosphoryl-undecaprenol N-acetylglucosamine transferase [Acidimicrobiia bacterium]|nr:UDP-N-acetylglucosamine--N-acetylmuramyl-(pentapeptide) pyrophosphoryl-undecaprenol N-acetylglucosamine transferase [Acidimicrobiia bacterium]